jgi:two-component system, sensor histidine kinase
MPGNDKPEHKMETPAHIPLVLNVDDTEAARYAKTRTLTRAGMRVIEAVNGTEALKRAREEHPDLILLDVKLPDINGFEVCRRLKADEPTRAILILQTSASYIASSDKIMALEGGADNYLFEPIEPEELVANVRALLRLRRVERELREADRRKDIFLATLGHELRNPLAPIRTAAELLCRLDPDAPPLQQRAKAIILRQSDHMVRLVDDLLDVSRFANGKIQLRTEPVELHVFVGAGVETAQPVISAHGHNFTLNLPQDEIWVTGDKVRLAQVISNLLNNAAKFTPNGGAIVLAATQAADHVHITISDSGIGLPATDLKSIFELFTQAEHAPERSRAGLGIGLSLVQGLVELHGGSISASSPGTGMGSTFEVRLPVIAAPGSSEAAEESTDQEQHPRRILVVDDNVDAAVTVSLLLELQGHVVETCYTGCGVLEQVRSFRPEVVLLDIGMPDLNGLEVARQLRAQDDLKDLVLIALSGYGKKEDVSASREAGFDAHLTKPVSIDVLSASIRDISSRL